MQARQELEISGGGSAGLSMMVDEGDVKAGRQKN